MALLGLKLILTPIMITLVTLAGRRWGPAVSGLLVGLPITSGPVSVFLAIEQGNDFAAQAAVGTLVGLAAVGVFCVAYSRTALSRSWPISILVAILAFIVAMVALGRWTYQVLGAFVLATAFLAAAFFLIPNVREQSNGAKSPKWDVPLRMLVATGLVLGLTEAGSVLGPQLSGLLSPIPIFSTVLAVFAHHTGGSAAAIRLFKGLAIGLLAFAVFFLIVGAFLLQLGIALTYVLATVATLVVSALAHLAMRGTAGTFTTDN